MSYYEQELDKMFKREEEAEERLPKCCDCGEPIQGEYLYNINGNLYCEYCLIEAFREDVEDYID